MMAILSPFLIYGQTFGFDPERYNMHDEHTFSYWSSIHEIKEKYENMSQFCFHNKKDRHENAYINIVSGNEVDLKKALNNCVRSRITAINFYFFKTDEIIGILKYMDSFPNLVRVNILAPGYCKFTALPDKFYGYSRVKALAINANIEDLSGITRLKNLEYLQIASDSLISWPGRLTSLKYLYITGNLCIDSYLEQVKDGSENTANHYYESFVPDTKFISYKNANPSPIKSFNFNYNQLKSLYLNVSHPVHFKRADKRRKYFDFLYISTKAIFHPKDNIVTNVLLLDKKSTYNNITINTLLTDSITFVGGLHNCRINTILYCIGTEMPKKSETIEEINKTNNQWEKLKFLQSYDKKSGSDRLRVIDQKYKIFNYGKYYNLNKNINTSIIYTGIHQNNISFRTETNKIKNITLTDSLIINANNSRLSFDKINSVNILTNHNSNIPTSKKITLKSRYQPIIDSLLVNNYHHSFKKASVNFLQIDSLTDLRELEIDKTIRTLKILKISPRIDPVKFIQYINKLTHIERVAFPWIKDPIYIKMLNDDFKIEVSLKYYAENMDHFAGKQLIVIFSALDWSLLGNNFNPNINIEYSK